MEDGLSFQGSFGGHAQQHGVHLQQEHVLPRKATQQAEAIVSAQAPYRIKSVNDAWVELFGFRCVASLQICAHRRRAGSRQMRLRTFICPALGGHGLPRLRRRWHLQQAKISSIFFDPWCQSPQLLGTPHLLGCLGCPFSHTTSVRIARSAYQAHGRSLALVQGPGTDGMSVNFLIKHAALGMSHSSTVNFYTRTGEPVNMLLQVSPMGTDDIRIVMIPTQAGESPANSLPLMARRVGSQAGRGSLALL